ncbi:MULTISPECIES: ABC transporter ATP-binding protein [Pseudolactococcus]|jgi:ABC-2 type transport system ATP-binding protein|uniref:ABC transporter ATP-binding protein n=1 Tax=Pseudolactococcus TaxID=3436058 RepID=UPI001C706FC3|nr:MULTISPECIES: ABC transporter ATP-binding protein [Lactococcus]MBW9330359.1 ABC transporter ATP-binding protein [Lactococcus raffinolactis]MCH4161978.1 ABC transporter ATP-binding protein [Lactococcus raffinolactis]MDD3015199.1 ABC transporter ATP-binding protein [Lactococcus chungangensis]
MTENNIAVKIDHVSKSFRLPTEASTSLRTTMVNYFRGIKGYKEQHILKDISFDVKKGDFFGIVGKNGSGKSTLLKIISQIYAPEKGAVTVNGNLVSFIELGVGFNPELTGRENVYLNGALLGFSKKEMDELYDEVVAFSELEEFMDRKLKNYSSGMQVRLAFSIAIHADSEILLLDEILAVGDEAFQAKCNDYFLQLKEEGKTVILVTHDMGSVKKYCNKAVLIDDGEVKVIGSPDDVANQYSLDNFARVISDKAEEAEEVEKIVEVDQLTVKMNSPEIITESDTIDFDISYQVLSEIESYIAFSITDVASNAWIYNDNSFDLMTEGKGKKSFNYQVKLPMLNSRKLKLQVSVRNGKNEMVAFASSENTPMIIIERTDVKTISEKDSATGVINRNGNWRVGL